MKNFVNVYPDKKAYRPCFSVHSYILGSEHFKIDDESFLILKQAYNLLRVIEKTEVIK